MSPEQFQFSWELVDNCPPDPGAPAVGCYAQAQGPHDLTADSVGNGLTCGETFEFWGITFDDACCWGIEGGEVTYDGVGACDTNPRITLVIGRQGTNYAAYVSVEFFGQSGIAPFLTNEACLILYYKDFGAVAPACNASFDLDWFNSSGTREGFFGGGFVPGGYGPGCNSAFGTPLAGGNTFPHVITITPI